jgi:hypothetical protein
MPHIVRKSVSGELAFMTQLMAAGDQLERLHIFDRERLVALGEAGFDVVKMTASGR